MNMPSARQRRSLLLALGFAIAAALALLLMSGRAAAAGGIAFAPVSARDEPAALGGAGVKKGDAVAAFKYIVNVDNTGTTASRGPSGVCDPAGNGFPGSCHWTSMGVPGSAPIATQGDEKDFANGGTISLPDGRYLVSVLADGYKLDGEHFTVANNAIVVGPTDAGGKLIVQLQPTPVPDATVRALVFNDNSPTNGALDTPAEHGLAGFQGELTDYLGQLITDVYGKPLCTFYKGEDPVTHQIDKKSLDAGGMPIPDESGRAVAPAGSGTARSAPGHCRSGDDGILTIPHLGTNRYALQVIPPNGQTWVQTTTLEGNHDWDIWAMEGNTGYDTEFAVGAEPVPQAQFGFVQPKAMPANASGGEIKGVVDAMKVYVPANGGLTNGVTIWGGLNGGKIDHPIDRPWVALSDLSNGDQLLSLQRGNPDGTFDFKNVPDGNYTITWWDDAQNYIIDTQNVTVANGQVEDLGILPLSGWWSTFTGHVFNDLNGNGKQDPGEPGIKDFNIILKKRENSLMDRGQVNATTAPDGSFKFEGAYPMTQWLVMEAYNERYHTTGVTYQADNQPAETTVLGNGVDVSIHPVIGLGGRIDWGVQPYKPGTNGGIVGTVTYDTTRNELDPRYAATEDWQPGVPNVPVKLYEPVPCGTTTTTRCATTPAGDSYEVDASGAYTKGRLLNLYTTENWTQPGRNNDGNCVPRDVNGSPLNYGPGQLVTKTGLDPYAAGKTASDCLEGPMMGIQFQQGFSTVNGNYGFTDGCFVSGGYDEKTGKCAGGTDPTALPPGDYLVSIDLPADSRGKPMYKVTKEEDVNIAHGDTTVPQVPPPACAGPLHTVDVAGSGTDNYPAVDNANGIPGVTVPASTPVDNPQFADPNGMKGSPYEGQQRPLCDTKLVTVSNQRSVAPNFNVFTDVPLPGRFWGLIVDDLNFSADKKSLMYGEKAGIAFAPVGIYDYTDRLVTTVESDFNGLFDVLLPSTNRINCPTPSGVCSNVYRFVGNDPGVPGRLNQNYKPDYRTIAAEFEAFPGLLAPADLAPTQVGVTVQLPTGQAHRVVCALDDSTPQLMAVSKPYADVRGSAASRTITIDGQGFGGAAGRVVMDGTITVPTTSWTDARITLTVPANAPQGPHQIDIINVNGKSTVNGITFHVIGAQYNPVLFEVGPGKAYQPANTLPAAADHALQHAIDAAEADASARPKLVVVYPGAATPDNPRMNPRGAYYENLIVSKPLKIQGTGPGGVRSDGTTVPGAILDGSAFSGDSAVTTDWATRLGSLAWAGNQTVNDGAVITVLARTPTTFGATPSDANAASIDGLDIRGGDQQGFPTNINVIGGGKTGLPPAIQTQGGAVYVNAYARALRITNNVVQNNGGSYGTIRVGTPNLPAPDTNNHNENIRLAKNRIIQNAGTNLAGAIGLFAGSDNYDVANNDICGNFSAEYGGGITAYGLSPNGRIRDNRIYFNRSYDEGGGIMIAGQLPADPSTLSPGSGPVSITGNLFQANLANDDGGGIRFLMAGASVMNVANNMIANNVSTHEGGGVALDDAPRVQLVNNTIMKNLTTATAVTSNGAAAPAGLSTARNSGQLQATLPANSPVFSDPLQFNNIYWDNRAGSLAAGAVVGLGIPGDATPVRNWDMGTADGSGALHPTNSVIQSPAAAGSYVDAPSNKHADPAVKAPFDVSVDFAAWRTHPAFVAPTLIALDLPPNLMGDYHLKGTASPAYNAGAAAKAAPAPAPAGTNVAAPTTDFDHQARPAAGAFDIGADELVGPTTDLGVTITDNQTVVAAGQQVTYVIKVTNYGPANVTGAALRNVLKGVTAARWTCAAVGGSCQSAFGLGDIANALVNLNVNGTATFTLVANVDAKLATDSTVSSTATVRPPAGVNDSNPANDTATDTDTVRPRADLAIAMTRTPPPPASVGDTLTYQLTVTNPSANPAQVSVADAPPATLGSVAWTCAVAAGDTQSSCSTATAGQAGAGGTGNLNQDVIVGPNSAIAFTLTGVVQASIYDQSSLALANTATATPIDVADANPLNNTATASTSVRPPLRDAFGPAGRTALGGDWAVSAGTAIGVNSLQQALNPPGATRQAIWTQGADPADATAPNPASLFGADQVASLTPVAGTVTLALKTGGGTSAASPTRGIRVTYAVGSGTVTITAFNNGAAINPPRTVAASFNGTQVLTAVSHPNGHVRIYRDDVLMGDVLLPNGALAPVASQGGRVGIALSPSGRTDDFRAGGL